MPLSSSRELCCQRDSPRCFVILFEVSKWSFAPPYVVMYNSTCELYASYYHAPNTLETQYSEIRKNSKVNDLYPSIRSGAGEAGLVQLRKNPRLHMTDPPSSYSPWSRWRRRVSLGAPQNIKGRSEPRTFDKKSCLQLRRAICFRPRSPPRPKPSCFLC